MRGLALVALWLAVAGCAHTPAGRPELSPRARAEQLIASGESAKAIPLLQQLHTAAPEDLEVARVLAEAQVKAGRTAPFLESLAPLPPTASRHFMRALVLFAQAADATSQAQEQIDAAIALAPRQAELHFRKGLMLLESEKFEASLAPLTRAHQLAPERTGYLLPLAKARARNADSKGAVDAIRLLIGSQPTPAQVETARALMNELSDPYTRVPRAAEARMEEGLGWLQRYDAPQQAIVLFEDILSEFPDLAVVHALLGLAYQRLDDAGRAVDEFRQAIALAPDHGRFHFYLAQVYLSRHRAEQARAELEKSVALDPLLEEAHHKLGDLAFERRELDASRRHFQTLVALQPDSPPARGKLATLLQMQGDFTGAERHLRAVLEKDPENLEFSLRMGTLLTERAQAAKAPQERTLARTEAEEWLNKVLKVSPQNATASAALEQLKKL